MSDQSPEAIEHKLTNGDAPLTQVLKGATEENNNFIAGRPATGDGDQSARAGAKSNALESNHKQPNNVLVYNHNDEPDGSADSNSGQNKLDAAESADEAPSTRKGSAVSFKEKCDFYEVNLAKRISHGAFDCQQYTPVKPPFTKSLRYFIILLSLISPFIVTYSRTIINFAVTDMILNEEDNSNNNWVKDNTTSTGYYFYHDKSCRVDDETRDRLIKDLEKDEKRRQVPGEKFDWDSGKQGWLKGAYPFGHALLQVVGGRYSEVYGSHWIMSISALLIGICCLAAPFLASIHYFLLVIDLALLGVLGSFMSPSLITLFSNWLTPSEKSVALSFYLVASRLGYALSSFLFAILIDAQLSWKYLFYTAGKSTPFRLDYASEIFDRSIDSRLQYQQVGSVYYLPLHSSYVSGVGLRIIHSSATMSLII